MTREEYLEFIRDGAKDFNDPEFMLNVMVDNSQWLIEEMCPIDVTTTAQFQSMIIAIRRFKHAILTQARHHAAEIAQLKPVDEP